VVVHTDSCVKFAKDIECTGGEEKRSLNSPMLLSWIWSSYNYQFFLLYKKCDDLYLFSLSNSVFLSMYLFNLPGFFYRIVVRESKSWSERKYRSVSVGFLRAEPLVFSTTTNVHFYFFLFH